VDYPRFLIFFISGEAMLTKVSRSICMVVVLLIGLSAKNTRLERIDHSESSIFQPLNLISTPQSRAMIRGKFG